MAELVPAAAMAAFALASGYATLSVYRDQQAIAETETTTVNSLTPGEVKLEGRVEAESTVQSPITGAEGVVVDWEVNGEKDDDENDDRLAGGQRTGEFSLADESGSVRIDPPYGAELTASDQNTHVDKRYNPTLESLEAVDEGVRSGDDDRGDGTIMVSQAPEYDEVTLRHEILRPDDELTVVGTAQRTDNGMVVGGGDSPFVLSDMSESELVAAFRKKVLLLGAATGVFLVGVVYFLAFA